MHVAHSICYVEFQSHLEYKVNPALMSIPCFNFSVKQLTTKTDDRAWYEKLEDYEGDFEFVDDGEEGEQGKKIKIFRCCTGRCNVYAP